MKKYLVYILSNKYNKYNKYKKYFITINIITYYGNN